MSLLRATGVAVHERHRPLLPPTSLALQSGEVLVVSGDPGHGHTVLALALAGRLDEHDGTVTLDDDASPKGLQRAVALVDVPGVSAPDESVPVATIVGEELAMAGERAGRARVQQWMAGLDLPSGRVEDLTSNQRVRMLARLAGLRDGVQFLVLVLPERNGGRPDAWLPVAQELAGDGFGVLVTTSHGGVPAGAAVVALGNDEELSA